MTWTCFLTRGPAFAVLAFAIAGCSNSDGGGAGGNTSTGGDSGAGGLGGSSSGAAGTAGRGGGGTGGSSAGSGTGGVSGDASCSTEPYAHTFGFGALFEGWTISSFSTPSLIPMTPAGGTGGMGGGGGDAAGGDASGGDAGDSSAGDGSGGTGGAGGGATGTVMELDTADGSPDSPDGSIKLTIPFDGPAQLLLLGTVFNTGLNFTGTTVTAQIKLDSGLVVTPSDTGRAFLVLKATDGLIYHAGPAVVLDPSAGWTTLTIDPEAPSAESLNAGYTPCSIREIDIEIHTSDTGSYREAVVHIDAITVTPKE